MRISAALLVGVALAGCTQHDAADPTVDITPEDLAGNYTTVDYFAESNACRYAWLDLGVSGDFALTYGFSFEIASESECAAAETAAELYGGWSGRYSNLGSFIAFRSDEYLDFDENGELATFQGRTDILGEFDAGEESIAVTWPDPWGFGEDGEGGKAGGKEDDGEPTSLVFYRD